MGIRLLIDTLPSEAGSMEGSGRSPGWHVGGSWGLPEEDAGRPWPSHLPDPSVSAERSGSVVHRDGRGVSTVAGAASVMDPGGVRRTSRFTPP